MNNSGPANAAWNKDGTVPDTILVLRLYVAGRGPNSMRAMANLDALVKAVGREHFEIEIVDVLMDPERALQDHVLVTPTLVKLAPLPMVQVAGDLSNVYRVVYALGLDPGIEFRRGE